MKAKGKYELKVKRWHELMLNKTSSSADIAQAEGLTKGAVVGAVWRYRTGRSK